MRRAYRTLNDCEMQHNAEVGLFTKSSDLKLHFIPEELPLFFKKRKVYILLTNNR